MTTARCPTTIPLWGSPARGRKSGRTDTATLKGWTSSPAPASCSRPSTALPASTAPAAATRSTSSSAARTTAGPRYTTASGAFYRASALAQFKGNFFFGCLRGEGLQRVVLDGRVVRSEERLFGGEYGRIRDVAEG